MITGGGWAALDSGREGADRRGDAEPGRTVPVIARFDTPAAVCFGGGRLASESSFVRDLSPRFVPAVLAQPDPLRTSSCPRPSREAETQRLGLKTAVTFIRN
jgi:hypothetical protein